MSFDDERRAIEMRLRDNYTATAVQYQNIKFNQPANTSWIALSVLPGAGNQVSLGNRSVSSPLDRHAGVIQIDINVPEEQGTKAGTDIADLLFPIFAVKQFSAGSSGTITTRTPSIQHLGLFSGWWRIVFSVVYRRDKVRT